MSAARMGMRHRSKTAKVGRFIRKVERFINRTQFYPRSRPIAHPDRVTLGLLSKSLVLGKAISQLVKTGFHEEAFGLTRTLIEIMFTMRYLTNKDSIDRSDKYVYYWAKDHEAWTRILQKYYASTPLDMPAHHAEMLRIAKRYKHPHRWVDETVREMAVENDTYDKAPDGKPATSEWDYEVTYKWTSHYVHATIVAAERHMMGEGLPFVVNARAKESLRFAELALFNTVTYIARILLYCFRCLGRQTPAHLSREFDSVMRSLTSKEVRNRWAKAIKKR